MYAARHFAAQYRRTGVETQVLEADPHKLIALMLSGARQRLQLASACVINGDVVRKAKAAAEAGAIIDALSACLDKKAGGTIADQLEALYDYCSRRLLEANVSRSGDGFIEIDNLLADIESAWTAIRPAEAA